MNPGNGDVYVGDVVQGERQGHGNMKYANGDMYDGEWSQGKHQGHGIMTSSHGDVCEGNWDNGQRKGDATITYRDDNSRFEGRFKNDRATGTKTSTSWGWTTVRHGFVSPNSLEFHESGATKECPICYEHLDEDEQPVIKIASCGHVFHLKCIREHQKYASTCPFCMNADTDLKYVIGDKTHGYRFSLRL